MLALFRLHGKVQRSTSPSLLRWFSVLCSFGCQQPDGLSFNFFKTVAILLYFACKVKVQSHCGWCRIFANSWKAMQKTKKVAFRESRNQAMYHLKQTTCWSREPFPLGESECVFIVSVMHVSITTAHRRSTSCSFRRINFTGGVICGWYPKVTSTYGP